MTILFFWLCSFNPLAGQSTDYSYSYTPVYTFSGEIHITDIPMAIGRFYEMPVISNKKPTAFIRADRMLFSDASLGKIDSCSVTYELKNDTIRKVIITLPTALSIKQAGKQAGKQFGKPVYHKDGVRYVYTWIYRSRCKGPSTIRLEVNEDQASGMMYVTAGQ